MVVSTSSLVETVTARCASRSHQLKSYVASKSRLKLAVRAVLSADAGLLVQLVTLHWQCIKLIIVKFGVDEPITCWIFRATFHLVLIGAVM